ncbi:MAG: hypothetical protein ABSH01_09615 [Terriglobia bacterium]
MSYLPGTTKSMELKRTRYAPPSKAVYRQKRIVPPVALLANFIAWREENQILFPQGGIRMTCHSERSEESAFGCGYAAL